MAFKNNDDRVIIFDTTLRDGEQSPGASMNQEEKLEIAIALADLGVDVIEAGFPMASKGDFNAVRAVAEQIEGPTITALCRCNVKDIEGTYDALRVAKNHRIHTVLATSPIHREYKLRMTREQVLERTREGVSRARSLCDDVEFSAEDASRTEPEFLAEAVETAILAGATTVSITDTVGYAMPEEFHRLFLYLSENVPSSEKAIFSVHCHNDLGMAVSNSLAAVRAGARQIECTINGLGERAGNCALEEVVMALRTRPDIFEVTTGINTPLLSTLSQLVSSVSGFQVQRNKAIVGENAFSHEAGIHQHGMLMNKSTYQIMLPEDVGVAGNKLVLGKHSGRYAFKNWLVNNGYDADEVQLKTIFAAFKALADTQKEISNAELVALVEHEIIETIGS